VALLDEAIDHLGAYAWLLDAAPADIDLLTTYLESARDELVMAHRSLAAHFANPS
jgi:hypothetical protein